MRSLIGNMRYLLAFLFLFLFLFRVPGIASNEEQTIQEQTIYFPDDEDPVIIYTRSACEILITNRGDYILFNGHALQFRLLNLYHRDWCGCDEKWWEKD